LHTIITIKVIKIIKIMLLVAEKLCHLLFAALAHSANFAAYLLLTLKGL
jgi:hypothetical protein